MKTILFLIALPIAAQPPQQFPALPLSIVAGSPTDKYFTAIGTFAYTDAKLPAPWISLRYGTSVHYRIPCGQAGLYFGALDFLEPNATGSGKRIMTVTINGVVSQPIDVFALSGAADVLVRYPFAAFVPTDVLDILITGVVGNAIVSGIDLQITQNLSPFALVSGPAALAVWPTP